MLANCEGAAVTYKYKITDSIDTRNLPQVNPNPRRTICDVHRDIYDIALNEISDPDVARQVQELTAEAFDFGKRMMAKLIERKQAADWLNS